MRALIAALALGLPGAAAAIPPAPRIDAAPPPGLQSAVLAGGCFWGIEAVFEHVKGVRSVVSGYAGGAASDATYAKVSGERTGHAEAVKIVYDPKQVSYGTLLRIFFASHDPTEVNRQGPDTGPSYRTAIFPQNEGQQKAAAAYLAQLKAAKAFPRAIATRLESGAFYPAEAQHQDFAKRNPRHPYIVRWDAPKVAALRAGFPGLYRN
jgi:peptide-methionine (S)-S-oxide reductase